MKEISLSNSEVIYGSNVIGAAMVSEACKPLLSKSEGPYLIHIASMMDSTSQYVNMDRADYKSYRMSKAALLMPALGDFREAKAQGSRIKVFAACPGYVVSNLRGTSELQRSGWGHAGDPEESGRMILDVIEGRRDADDGKFVHKGGVYPLVVTDSDMKRKCLFDTFIPSMC